AVVLVERQVVLAPEHALLADDRLQLVDQRGPGWADGWRRHASPSRGARRQVYPSGPGRLGRGRSNEARRRGARRGQRRPRRRGRGAPPPTMRTTSSTSPSAIWTSSKRARLTISPLRSTATMRGSTPSAWRKPSTEQGPAISRGFPLTVRCTWGLPRRWRCAGARPSPPARQRQERGRPPRDRARRG